MDCRGGEIDLYITVKGVMVIPLNDFKSVIGLVEDTSDLPPLRAPLIEFLKAKTKDQKKGNRTEEKESGDTELKF